MMINKSLVKRIKKKDKNNEQNSVNNIMLDQHC